VAVIGLSLGEKRDVGKRNVKLFNSSESKKGPYSFYNKLYFWESDLGKAEKRESANRLRKLFSKAHRF
jgi:hypothetical protein